MNNSSFNHSVKVPRLYKCAAKICQEVAGGAGSVKQLVYEKTHFNTKALYALVITVFQKSTELNMLLERTQLLEKETRFDPWLAKILIAELLWGKKQLPQCEAKPILTILSYEPTFRAHLSDTSEQEPSATKQKNQKPRYIRINTLMTSVNEALELFQEEGWTLVSHTNKEYNNFLEQVLNLQEDCFMKDFHIPELLIFPGGTEFYNHPGYKKGVIILQDKASCLPVHILSPTEGSVVLDMCAAPGMKTTQLAATIGNNGTVYAIERDAKRFDVLKMMVNNSGAKCVKVVNRDVLECNNKDFPDVEYIIVDPSCSGSGMVDRSDFQFQTNDPTRLRKLAGFQIKILRSALTRYPNAKKVVYSTCSLHPEENEDVVRQVLESNANFKLIPAGQVLKQWNNFGSSDFGKLGAYCLYARPQEDLTNGFFLAVFEKLEEGEQNEFFNSRVLGYKKKMEQKLARRERKRMGGHDGGLAEEQENGQEVESKKIPKKDKKMRHQLELNNQQQELDNMKKKKSHDESTEQPNSLMDKEKKKSKRQFEKKKDEDDELKTSHNEDIERKKKKRKIEAIQEVNIDEQASNDDVKFPKSKKKKDKPTDFEEEIDEMGQNEKIRKKKKIRQQPELANQIPELDNGKKKNKIPTSIEILSTGQECVEDPKKKKKSKRQSEMMNNVNEELQITNNEDINKIKKKKSVKKVETVEELTPDEIVPKKKKKRKHAESA